MTGRDVERQWSAEHRLATLPHGKVGTDQVCSDLRLPRHQPSPLYRLDAPLDGKPLHGSSSELGGAQLGRRPPQACRNPGRGGGRSLRMEQRYLLGPGIPMYL